MSLSVKLDTNVATYRLQCLPPQMWDYIQVINVKGEEKV